MTISIIFAITESGVIGRGGAIPWHLPADLKRFKTLTTGHTVVMGRKTFESIGKALPDRRNVVLTRTAGFHSDGIVVANKLSDALRGADGGDEFFVAGGAEVYRQTIAMADRVYQTLVRAEIHGDTTFTQFVPSEWELLEDEFHEPDAAHKFPFNFRLYGRPKKRPVS